MTVPPSPTPSPTPIPTESDRLALLLDAVVSLGAGLSLDALLSRIVTSAGQLAGARYVALGVLGTSRDRPLRAFVHHGMTPGQVVEIGELPTGHGLLGLIIDQPHPLRLRDLADHPASYGFPPGHPPMSSFLGVPVRIRDQVFGNLYLTEKQGGGDFTEQDERIVVALAAAVGVTIENAQLHDLARRREHWLAATAEITRLLVGSAPVETALQTVADRAREVSGADIVWVVAGEDADSLSVQVVSGANVDWDVLRGVSLEHSLAREVVRSGRPVSVDDLPRNRRAVVFENVPGWPAIGSAMLVPLRASGSAEGALALAWTPERAASVHDLEVALPASFAEQAALALQTARAREDRQRLALFEDRDRIGRDLHDLVIQRLFAVGLSLEGAARISDRPDVATRLDSAVDDLDATISDIRRTIFALGSGRTVDDVQTEVTRLVDSAAATMKFRPVLRFTGPVRTLADPAVVPDLLAVLRELLSNVSRHAGASRVDVLLAAGDTLALVVEDDGRGIPEGTIESGLHNIRVRAEQHGGHCEVEPAGPAGGTRVRWIVPLA